MKRVTSRNIGGKLRLLPGLVKPSWPVSNGHLGILVTFECALFETYIFHDFKVSNRALDLAVFLAQGTSTISNEKPHNKTTNSAQRIMLYLLENITTSAKSDDYLTHSEVRWSNVEEITREWAQYWGTVTSWYPKVWWDILVRVYGARILWEKKTGRAGRRWAQDWVEARIF